MFKREDWTLYRSLNTLGQKAGVAAELIPRLVAKELADNALDAGGRCRVGMLAENGFWIEDDGDGIPGSDAQIAALFSINRPLTSTKIVRRPSRGAMGNGLRVVAGAVLATSGRLTVSTRGRTLDLIPQEDTGKTIATRVGEWPYAGCRIEVRFGPSLKVGADDLIWAQQANLLAEGDSSYTGGSSPYWYDSEAFYVLLKAAGSRTVRDVIAGLHGCAEPKAGRIAAAFKNRYARTLNRDEADQLLIGARGMAKPIKPSALGRVGHLSHLPAGYAVTSGVAPIGSPRSEIEAELPIVVEAWAEKAEWTTVQLYVNRTPITGELHAWKEKTTLCLQGCGLGLEVPCGKGRIHVRINIQIPFMPITTDGKEPNIEPFEGHIKFAIAKAIRKAKRDGAAARDSKLTKKKVIVENLPNGIAAASGEGRYRFSERQLFYAIRGAFIEAFGQEPGWGYFCQVITNYENQHGDISGLYRDPRGIIYHPHLGEEIPLGTLYVEQYERPPWLFKNVLYCEKEGLFAILRAEKWAEKNDCALMTSKGFSGRAARDLIDLLAETDEECNFYCIQDADAAGTMIYQTLQEATKARGARKVKIVNLGLEPAEAREMGLPVEKVKRKSRKVQAVADYVGENDRLWLQRYRVELNAMTTPQFLEWLDRKFQPYAGKLIPPREVLEQRLRNTVLQKLRQERTESILRAANLDGQVEEAFSQREHAMAAASAILPEHVGRALEQKLDDLWVKPVDQIAHHISRSPTT